MKNEINFHTSFSKIPPHNLVKYPVRKQSPLSNLIFGKILKKYGLVQIRTYYKTKRRNHKIIFPYMPKRLPNNAYLYDFHTHTRYSDGRGNFKEILMQISKKKHLNGIAITDHPWKPRSNKEIRIIEKKVVSRSFKFSYLVDKFKKKGKLPDNFISFPGSCEFMTKLNEDNPKTEIELIALGISKDFIEKNGGLKHITNSYAVDLIEKIHDDNGLVILPHPFFSTRAHELLRYKLSKNSRPDAMEGINYSIGFLSDETYQEFFKKLPFSSQLKVICKVFGYFNWMSTIISQENDFGKHFNYPIAKNIATVGSSDAHFLSMVGAACTVIMEPITSIEDIRKVFSKRKTIPILNPLWGYNTEKKEVFNEFWEEYGKLINDRISHVKKQPFIKIILVKVFIDILSYILD